MEVGLIQQKGCYGFDDILLRITPAAQQLAIETLADENNRRSDRKKTALCDS